MPRPTPLSPIPATHHELGVPADGGHAGHGSVGGRALVCAQPILHGGHSAVCSPLADRFGIVAGG